MTPENFCYWLQGFMELSNDRNLTPEAIQSIRDHLTLVFIKLTPLAYATPDTKLPASAYEIPEDLEVKFCQAIEEGKKGMKANKMNPNYVGISRTAC
jgi:hypothetical protein